MNTFEKTNKGLSNELYKAFSNWFEEKYSDATFSSFEDYFNKNRSEFDSFLKTLGEDKDKVIKLGFFYNVVTKDIKHAGVILISLFSIMEATASDKYRSFDQWLLTKIKKSKEISYPIEDKDNFKDLILDFQEEYFEKHGSSKKVRTFIKRYFSDEDKRKMVNGFIIKDKSSGYHVLNFDDKLKVITDALYGERNAFVHQGRLPQIFPDSDALGCLKILNKDTPVSIRITIGAIQKMFERAFMKFLEETYNK